MSLKAITVNTVAEAEPHIYAQDDAAIYQSIVGSDGVFNIGNKFAASILSNNSVRVSDGVLCVGGHIARTAYADYQDMVIENGASGQNRNDIIVAKFLTEGSVDTLTLEVKKGTPGSAATDPALTRDNLYQGGTVREYPLWRVKLEGLSITDVEQMYTEIPTIPELLEKINELNTNLIKKVLLQTYTSSPLTSLAETTLQFDLSDFDEVEINFLFGGYTGRPIVGTVRAKIGGAAVEIQTLANITGSSNIVAARRQCHATTTSIVFGACSAKTVTGTEEVIRDYLLPYTIYGIKY